MDEILRAIYTVPDVSRELLKYAPYHLFTILVSFVESLFLILHVAFLFKKIPVLKKRLDSTYVNSAFVVEHLAPVWVLFFTPVPKLDHYTLIALFHLVVHIGPTIAALISGPPKFDEVEKTATFAIKFVGLSIVMFDTLVHFTIYYRMYTVIHMYTLILGWFLSISLINAAEGDWFTKAYVEQQKKKRVEQSKTQ